MTFQKGLFILFTLSLLSSSCISLKAPTFLGIDSAEMSTLNAGEIAIKSAVRLNNPNKAGLFLKEMKIEMSSNNNVLGVFMQQVEAPILGMSDFSVPFSINFDPKTLGNNLLATALSMFTEQKLKLKFRGYVKVGGKKRGFKIPLFYNETIKFK